MMKDFIFKFWTLHYIIIKRLYGKPEKVRKAFNVTKYYEVVSLNAFGFLFFYLFIPYFFYFLFYWITGQTWNFNKGRIPWSAIGAGGGMLLGIFMLSLTYGYIPKDKFKIYKNLLQKTEFIKRIHSIFYVSIFVLFFICGLVLSVFTMSFNK